MLVVLVVVTDRDSPEMIADAIHLVRHHRRHHWASSCSSCPCPSLEPEYVGIPVIPCDFFLLESSPLVASEAAHAVLERSVPPASLSDRLISNATFGWMMKSSKVDAGHVRWV